MKIKFILLLIGFSCFAQNKIEHSDFTLNPEFIGGVTLPSKSTSPKTDMQTIFGISFEKNNDFNQKIWSKVTKKPRTGISLYYTNFGNNKELGKAISLIPYIKFNLLKKKNLRAKTGFGISYFDTKYDAIDNPFNEAISTDLTWSLQIFLYYDVTIKKFDFTLGAGNFHHSNGHTRLPNFGINSALLSISTNLDLKKQTINEVTEDFNIKDIKRYSDWFYTVRTGYGIQDFLEEVTEDTVKSVYIFSAYAGIHYKEIYKLKFGIGYRFYQHYYDYIKENQEKPYIQNINKNSSNIYLSIGTEALIGHVGIDIEGGVHLYRPFYKKHYLLTEEELDFKYELKKLFLGRLGMKFYAINTSKKPKSNFFIAAHINSNLSQADFTEVSIGFTHRIKY